MTRSQFLLSNRFNCPPSDDPGIVDEDIDPTKGPLDLSDHLLHFRAFGNVTGDGKGLPSLCQELPP